MKVVVKIDIVIEMLFIYEMCIMVDEFNDIMFVLIVEEVNYWLVVEDMVDFCMIVFIVWVDGKMVVCGVFYWYGDGICEVKCMYICFVF